MSLKVLLLSRNYPNSVMPLMGLWVEGLGRHISALCEVRVISPVPYCPPVPGFVDYARFRRIPKQEQVNGVGVWHPRFLTGPGYSLHSFEASTYYWSIHRWVDQFRREFPFDLIHAHFSYPDGVVAARLGRRYGVPVVITEHAPWQPWMEKYPRVRRQAVWAARECAFHLPVSRYVQDTIVHFTGQSERLRVVPVGMDSTTFALSTDGPSHDPNQILYVGRIQHIKGVDVLLRAMRLLVDQNSALHLVLVGGSFYRSWRLEEEQMRRLATELGLEGHVEFVGIKPPLEVAGYMRESALLVLPSRAESLGAVLIEALACGTPVVATRCGGPEDIVNDEVGLLVPTEDAEALASAIDQVLTHRDDYSPAQLRAYALENFSWERIANRTVNLYREAIERFPEQSKVLA